MNRENYKSMRKGRTKRKSKVSGSKNRMQIITKQSKPVTSAKLVEIYATRTEWLTKTIPELKQEKQKA
jgi:hypothetical protein